MARALTICAAAALLGCGAPQPEPAVPEPAPPGIPDAGPDAAPDAGVAESDAGPREVSIACMMRAATILHIRDPDGQWHHWGADPFKRIEFPRNSIEIPDEAAERLLFIAEMAQGELPAAITVEGHTASYEHGEIARRRADAVRERLVALGVAPEIITVTSFGDNRPIYDPRSKQDRQKNARAEIRLDLTWPPIPQEFIDSACPPDAGATPP
jgi:outer membrane protein OmpA-like peptidoglycan-associated protein